MLWETVIKVAVNDPPETQARHISDGIGYACAILMDVHGWSAESIATMLERVTDEAYDRAAQ